MAGIKVKGLDGLIKKIENLGKDPEMYVKRSLYEGTGVMADAIRSAIKGLPIDESYGTAEHKKQGVTAIEKSGLLSGLGISRMVRADNNNVYVFIGFAWFNGKRKEGVKNSTVMRSIESGTSFRQKFPIIRQTKNRTKALALSAMQKQFEEDVDRLIDN